MDTATLEQLTRLIRSFILRQTTAAGSGHPTSSLSAVELMTVLLFGGFFRFDLNDPNNPANDRLIFSKGHASPLLYGLFAAAGKVSEEELMRLRKFGSPLEGHPTMLFPYTEAATGSLGQGLSVGVGMAINAQYLDGVPYRTFVLLGDSEMAEGSVWEAIALSAHYKLHTLIGILDVNRLGQRGETMYGHDLFAYKKRIAAFGWRTILLENGHDTEGIAKAYRVARRAKDRPTMIIARTIKGNGVSFIEDKGGWHGKALNREQLQRALWEIGEIDTTMLGMVKKPMTNDQIPLTNKMSNVKLQMSSAVSYDKSISVATRKAYGNALVRLFPHYPNIVVLDAEVSNSTFAETFKKHYPERFFEMYVAEQNMVSVALGLSRRGKKPFVSSFAAFLTRAHDQIRMCQYSDADIVFCGSHAGVSIGEDGASQMGLEDIAMFRAIYGSSILYPSDAVSTEKLVEQAAARRGITYIRTTRADIPILYDPYEEFQIGGCTVLRRSDQDVASVIAAGITVHEALAAYEALAKDGVRIRVIDLYSVKPIDERTLHEAVRETNTVITVEDHYPEGGLGEAVRTALANIPVFVYSLSVQNMPKSGSSRELLEYAGISKENIINAVKKYGQGNRVV